MSHLSEQERRMLETIDRQLCDDDPELARSFEKIERRSKRRWPWVTALAVFLPLFVVGMIAAIPILAALGAMGSAVALAVRFVSRSNQEEEERRRNEGGLRPE
jgi:Mg2+/citrate symporter